MTEVNRLFDDLCPGARVAFVPRLSGPASLGVVVIRSCYTSVVPRVHIRWFRIADGRLGDTVEYTAGTLVWWFETHQFYIVDCGVL